jgi:hypothetical protein
MSAWICSDFHINALVTWAAAHGVKYTFGGVTKTVSGNESETASLLYIGNVESVNSRYGEDTDSTGFRYSRKLGAEDLDPVVVIKACNCLSYQSCEINGWEERIAYQIIEEITRKAATMVCGYDRAQVRYGSALADVVNAAKGYVGPGVYLYFDLGKGPEGFYLRAHANLVREMIAARVPLTLRRSEQSQVRTAPYLLAALDLLEDSARFDSGFRGSFVEHVMDRTRHHFLRELPGYEQAPWGLDKLPSKEAA